MKKPTRFGITKAQKAKKATKTTDAMRELFRAVDVALLEIVAVETGISPERIIQNCLTAGLTSWFSYTQDETTGDVDIEVADFPDEPDLQRYVETVYHDCLRKRRSE